jgi:REP element-mobilizing transposase RayT
MPRRPRILVDGALYHVYCRTARGERIFAVKREAEAFLEIVRDVKQRDELTVLAWCLLPSHYHLLVRTSHVPLWRSMRLIQGRSAQSFNRRHSQLGSLWQERYKAKLVAEPAYFATVVAYIHLNPVAAGLVRDPSKYTWSGHRELLGGKGCDLLDADATMILFGATRGEARRAYKAKLAALRADKALLAEPERVPWWRRGAAADEAASPPSRRPGVDATGASSGRHRPRVEPQQFVDHACAALGVEVARLASPRRDRATVRARDLICLLAAERYAIRTQDLARLFGRNGDQLSLWTGRGSRRKSADPEFRQALDELYARLSLTLSGTTSQAANRAPGVRPGQNSQ